MADLDFSSQAAPVASNDAPDFSAHADPVQKGPPTVDGYNLLDAMGGGRIKPNFDLAMALSKQSDPLTPVRDAAASAWQDVVKSNPNLSQEDAARLAFNKVAATATPEQVKNPAFGQAIAASIRNESGGTFADALSKPVDAGYQESGPAAAAGAYMSGFSEPFTKAAAVPVGLAGGISAVPNSGGSALQDALFNAYHQMNTAGENAGGNDAIARSRIAGGIGGLAGNLATFALAPEVSGADAIPLVSKLASGGAVAQKLAPFLEHAVGNLPGALAAGGLPTGSGAAEKTLSDGGSLSQAFGEAAAGGTLGTAQFLAPTSLEGNILARAASGAAIQQGLSAAQQQAQHAIAPGSFKPAKAPDLSDPMTYMGAVLGAAGEGGIFGHNEGYADPAINALRDVGNVRDAPAPPSGPALLPAPDFAAQAKPAEPAPFNPDAAAANFRADPQTALAALDHPALVQVAEGAGFVVKPTDTPASIIGKITSLPTADLHSDVLPEYLHAVTPAAPVQAPASQPAPAQVSGPSLASALPPGTTVPVDAAGTAYTPQQGASELGQALGQPLPAAPALPPPVTTVDSQGNASNSATFLARTKAAQDEAAQLQNAVLHRQSLGITPDIERTQGPRWQAQQAAANENANKLSLQPDDEIATQREDDSPPWWLAGQHAEEQQASAQPLQNAIRQPGPANAPLHPWTPIDASQSIPYAGGQTKDLSTALIDKRVPKTLQIAGKAVDVHQAIGLHENIESSLIHNTKPWAPAEMNALAQRVGLKSMADLPAIVRQKLSAGEALSYSQGHNIATKGENHFVATTYGIPPAKYQMALKPAIAAALKHGTGASDIPANLDTKPYDNMGESHLVPQHDLEPLRKEIGWDQVGGRLLREPEADGQGGHAPVTGRTTWVGKAGPNGESDFWRMRPEKGGKISEAGANAALDKHAAGQPLNAREKRFIDYAQKTAAQHDADYHADLQQYQQDQADMSAASQAEARKLLAEAGVPPEDHAEALTLAQITERAYDAGADQRQILDATFEGSPADIARALWDLTRQLEQAHAQPESGSPRREADDGQANERPASTGAAEHQAEGQIAPAEQDRGVSAEADQVAPRGDLFAPANASDRIRAANDAKDATRNGLKGGREQNDAGGLFDGKRPEQVGLDDQGVEVRTHSMDDNSPEARDAKSAIQRDRQSHEDDERLMEQMRQESRDQGERDATSLGLRDAVSKALGGLSGGLKVEFVRNEMGLPKGVNLRPVTKGGRRMGTYLPDSKRVFIYTQTLPTKAEAAFTAAHEVYGHRAMRMLAEQHPDVKVGTMTAPEALNKALDAVLQNPTVRKVADSMGVQRKTSDPRLMAEEAMADLSAAAQTGNWDKIKTKHGVDVPEEMRAGVQGALNNFIERLKRILNAIMAKITGKPADFTDAQVHEFMQDSANALREPEKVGGEDGGSLDAADNVTETAAFKKWFGESKVVDAKGEPLVVYHGSPDMRFVDEDGIFKSLHQRYQGMAAADGVHWFTPDKSVAKTYADDRRAFDYQNAEAGLIPAFLKLENPLIVDGGGKSWREAQARGKTSDVIEQAKDAGHDGVIIRNVRDRYNSMAGDKNDRPTDTYAVFKPNQIKSATGNNGSFDATKPSILESIEPAEPPRISLTMVKQALRNRGVPEETIDGMSRDELMSEQASMRARSAPTPEMKETGVKNATKEEERGMKGKAAVEHDLSTSNPAQYATAKARFDADPLAGQMVAARVIADKKAITPEDSILLSLDAMRIINARQSAYEQAEKAMANGDEATRTAALSMVRQLDGQMEANDIASRYSGVRAGQALQARKVMIRQDYSMARMVLRAKVAKGEALTDAERSKVEKAASEIDRRTKELDAREAKLRAMEAEARPVAQKRAAKAKFDDLAAQLKAIAQKDHMKAGCVS